MATDVYTDGSGATGATARGTVTYDANGMLGSTPFQSASATYGTPYSGLLYNIGTGNFDVTATLTVVGGSSFGMFLARGSSTDETAASYLLQIAVGNPMAMYAQNPGFITIDASIGPTILAGTRTIRVTGAYTSGQVVFVFYVDGALAKTVTVTTAAHIISGAWVGPNCQGGAGAGARIRDFTYGALAPPGPTLTAVPNLTTMAVDLTVSGASGAITVTRYVQGASPTGTLVRGTFANGRTVPDTDAPLNTDLVYIARDTVGASPQQAARLDSEQSFLGLMSSPSLVAAVTVLADDNQTHRGLSTAHKILASNAPLVTVEPPAYRAGTYRLLLSAVDDWLQLRAILMTGGVLLLRSPCQTEYLDTAFIMTDARLSMPWNAAAPRHRIVELDYQATAPDATPPVDYAWTYADVPGVAATYADLPLQFPTYADLATYVPVP